MNINMVCLPNTTSYGTMSTYLLKELSKAGHKPSLFPVIQNCNRCQTSSMEAVTEEDKNVIIQCLKNAQLFDPDTPSVRVWHQNSLDMHVGRGSRVAWPIFELDRFNELELHNLRSVDELVVCSQWAKDILLYNNVKLPIHVVPLGVDTDIFNPNYHTTYDRKISPESTTFYCIGKKEIRKGHDFIANCFDRAFGQDDRVELHMFWQNRLISDKDAKAWDNTYRGAKLGSKIKLYDWLPTQRDLAAQICHLDCGLFVSRAEGFDLGLLESMAMGRQVIVTNYSGHTQFADANNSLLIDIDQCEQAYDGVWFHGQGNWGSFGTKQEEQLVEYMRYIHKRKQAGEDLFNAEGLRTANKLTWTNTAARLIEALS